MFLAKNSAIQCSRSAPDSSPATPPELPAQECPAVTSLPSSNPSLSPDTRAAALPASPRDGFRTRIDAAWRTPEPVCVPTLVDAARLPDALREPVRSLAHDLVSGLRATRSRSSGVDALMKEFSLSSQEGVALMCLAEALLRVPDKATADADLESGKFSGPVNDDDPAQTSGGVEGRGSRVDGNVECSMLNVVALFFLKKHHKVTVHFHQQHILSTVIVGVVGTWYCTRHYG